MLLARRGDATNVYLLDAAGEPLANHDGGPESAPPVWPIAVASVPDDPKALMDISLEPVPGTSVGMAGNRRDTVEAAAEYLIRHYRPALDPRRSAVGVGHPVAAGPARGLRCPLASGG
ncbi:hypothetical protein [Streptomyces sp. 7N604]|uniref:hypothetical protein n=1 Tax=Streptomyces sp. 7N604 TaxID=3457415 RepID=UPI003FD69449